jgi:transcriptional regulator with XRE-family HTH domain
LTGIIPFSIIRNVKRITVAARRKKLHLTQAQLAAQIGKPQSFISKIENGVITKPAFDDVVAIAKVLRVHPLRLDLPSPENEAVAS